jgi:hypothetical protein
LGYVEDNLDEQMELEDISIYPNPVFDILTMEFIDEPLNKNELLEIHLYSMSDAEMTHLLQKYINSGILKIDISKLPSGIYILTIPEYQIARYKIMKLYLNFRHAGSSGYDTVYFLLQPLSCSFSE